MAPNGVSEIVAMSTNGIIHSRKNYKVCTKLDENASYSLTELRPVQLPEDPDQLESQNKYKGEEEDHDSGYDEGRASESDEEKELESDEFGQGNLVIEESDSSPVPSPKRQDGKSKCLLEENKSTSTADESGKIQRRSDLRNESLKKMRDGKAWLIKTLIFVESAVCSLSLCEVVDEYRSYCRSTNRTPVTTPVLARLIRSVFSSATKCRVGPRGSQKIHYRNLQWRQDACNCSISKSLEKPEETVSSNEFQKVELFVSSCNQDQEKTQLEDHQDSQVIHSESLYKNCIEVNVKQESVDSLKDDDDKQVQENRKDLDPYSDEKESKSSEEREEEQEGKLLVEEAPDRRNPGEEAQIKDNQGECETAANGLSRVIKWMYEQNKMMTLLQYFAHSASCRNQTCSPICLMFRRVRRHVVGARHACSVLQVYSTLLRTHVSTSYNKNELEMHKDKPAYNSFFLFKSQPGHAIALLYMRRIKVSLSLIQHKRANDGSSLHNQSTPSDSSLTTSSGSEGKGWEVQVSVSNIEMSGFD
ncbi:hypothetical protein Pmani_017358 [Petrolisthes manimaculis]|uniref:RFX-type winged-helix domain-containing protein n=1 Tax=Petrolisthes manimaculis TaxID=1843537 RepID=A0AAE1PPQ6_9EUCA|nr:hypothetical protein Pmani_017358 [Petrolisthes manimaculis]